MQSLLWTLPGLALGFLSGSGMAQTATDRAINDSDIRRAEQSLAECAELADPVQDDGGDQVVLGREVAEHRALAHARPPGDVGHRGVQAALGELVGGRRQQQRAVARRVSAQRAGRSHQATITKLTERSVSS